MLDSFVLMVNLPSFIMVLLPTIAFSFIAMRPSEIFRALFGKQTGELNKITLDFLGNSFILAGAMGTFIGLIAMLANLDTPDNVIPGIAVSSQTIMYGFAFKFIIDSFKTSDINNTQYSETTEKIGISPTFSIIGIGIFLVSVIVGVNLGGSLSLFFNQAAFTICICGGTAAVFVSHSLEDIIDCLKGGFGGIYSNIEDAKKAVRVAANMYNRFISFGFIGLMMGLFVMFVFIDEPDRTGPGMAIALISFFYAMCLALLSLAFLTAARRQVNWFGEDEEPRLFMSPAASGLFSLGIVLVAFAVLVYWWSKLPG
jgi:flagellar motor component MotA